MAFIFLTFQNLYYEVSGDFSSIILKKKKSKNMLDCSDYVKTQTLGVGYVMIVISVL